MALPLTCLYGGLNVAGYTLTAALFACDVRFRYWILHGEAGCCYRCFARQYSRPTLADCKAVLTEGDGSDNTKLSAEQKALAQRRKGVRAS